MVSYGKIRLKGRTTTKDVPNEVTSSPGNQDEKTGILSLLCEEELLSPTENSPSRTECNDTAPSEHSGDQSRPSSTTVASVMEYSLSTKLSEESSQLIFSAKGLANPNRKPSPGGPRQLKLKRRKSDEKAPQPDESLSRPLFPEIGDDERLPMPINVSPKFIYLRPVTPEQQGRLSKVYLDAKPAYTPSLGAYRTTTVTPADYESSVTSKENKKRKARSPGSMKTTPPALQILPEPNGLDEIMDTATKMLSALRTTTASTAASNSTAAASLHSTSSMANTASAGTFAPAPVPSFWWPTPQGLQQFHPVQNVQPIQQQRQQEPQRLPFFPPNQRVQPSLETPLKQPPLKPPPQMNKPPQLNLKPVHQEQQAPQQMPMFPPFQQNVQPFTPPQLQVQQTSHEQVLPHQPPRLNVKPIQQQQENQPQPPSLPLFPSTPNVQPLQPRKAQLNLESPQQQLPERNLSRRLFDDVFSDNEDVQDDVSFDLMNAKDLEPDTSVYMCSRDPNNPDIPSEITTDSRRRDGASRQLPWFPVPPTNPVMQSQSSSALYFGGRNGGPPLANNNNNLIHQQQAPSPNRTIGDGSQPTQFGRRTRASLIDDDEPEEEIDIDLEKFFQQFEENQDEGPSAQPFLERDTSSLLTSPHQEQVGVRMARTQSTQGDDEDIGGLLSHVLLPSPTKHGEQPPHYSSSI